MSTADERAAAPNPLAPPPPPPAPPLPIAAPPLVAPRSTVRDTWGWLWKDTLGRVVPFALAALAYARFSGMGLRGIGLQRDHWRRDVLVGAALGVPLAGLAAGFRARIAPYYRLPTPADQAVQTAFYLGVNAPAEEIFWRGMLQNLSSAGLRRVPGLRRAAPFWGWLLITAAFGLYHRLGNWSWRSIAGVTAAGGLFGALYALRRPSSSLLAPIILHGFATAGFLSWGDVALHLLARRRHQRQDGGA